LALTAIPAAQAGARLAHRLPEAWLRRAFAVVLLATGTRMAMGP
ncbi:MAG: sulfite exporter TauE/SafE family protein, partial [Nitrospirae bacterium]